MCGWSSGDIHKQCNHKCAGRSFVDISEIVVETVAFPLFRSIAAAAKAPTVPVRAVSCQRYPVTKARSFHESPQLPISKPPASKLMAAAEKHTAGGYPLQSWRMCAWVAVPRFLHSQNPT